MDQPQKTSAQRSTKISKKLVVLEEPYQLNELPPSVISPPLPLDHLSSIESDAFQHQHLRKHSKALSYSISTNKQSRVSAYCTAAEYKSEILFKFLSSAGNASHSTSIQLFDECIYHRRLNSSFVIPQSVDTGDIEDFGSSSTQNTSNSLTLFYKEAFYLNYGVVVLWGYDQDEEFEILRALMPFEQDKIQSEDVEYDGLLCIYDPVKTSKIFNDVYQYYSLLPYLSTSTENHSQKLAISMALGQSVKLGYYEYVMDETIKKMQKVPQQIAKGGVQMSRDECVQAIGELFSLKQDVILSTSILDTPDLFWFERDNSPSYEAMRSYMEITQRVKILNQRSLVVSDLLDMLRENMTNTHEEYLEWVVILLVFISVVLAGFKIYLRVVEHD